MISTALTSVLALIEQVLPLITAGGSAGSVITTLESIIPLVISEVSALYTPLKNIIAALQSSGALTADQITQLQALDAQVDQAFADATQGLDPDAAPTS